MQEGAEGNRKISDCCFLLFSLAAVVSLLQILNLLLSDVKFQSEFPAAEVSLWR